MHPITIAFLAIWAIWALYWFATATATKQTVVQSQFWRWLQLIVVLALIFIPPRFPGYFNRQLLPPSEMRSWICVALTALGTAFAIWARRTLGSNWSGNPTIKEGHELIQTGPYRLARHPIYTGLLLAIGANCAAIGQMRDVWYLATAIVLFRIKMSIEEGFMLRQFPTAYPEYRRRTKALIPGVY